MAGKAEDQGEALASEGVVRRGEHQVGLNRSYGVAHCPLPRRFACDEFVAVVPPCHSWRVEVDQTTAKVAAVVLQTAATSSC